MRLASHLQKTEGHMIRHASERRSLVARAERRKNQQGAATVEYALLLFAVMICGASAIKLIGPAVACAGMDATGSLAGGGGGGGGCGGATASASGAGGSAGGSNSGSVAASALAAADLGAGGAGSSSGYIASATSYDDGAGGFLGGSGSSSGGLGNPNEADMDPGAAPPSSASNASSGSDSLSIVGGGGGGGGRGALGMSRGGDARITSNDDATNGSAGANGGEDSSAARGNDFASQVAGKKPEQIDLLFAELAMNTDGFNGKTPTKGAGPFVPATKDQLAAAGITQSMLFDKKDGFAAQVFTDGKGDYVVAYRGTQFPSISQAIKDPESLGGIGTDVAQGAGLNARQYHEAARLAEAAKTAYGNNVVFIGHSLGGGLAATSAAVTGLPAVTFNAAGVHDNMLQDLGLTPSVARAQAANGQARNYEVDHDIVSTAQNAPGSILPQAMGSKIEVKDPNPGLTAADAKKSNIFNLDAPIVNRGWDLHGDVVPAMKANPVSYRGADGKTDSFEFSNPSH
jgi:hypothetical protein